MINNRVTPGINNYAGDPAGFFGRLIGVVIGIMLIFAGIFFFFRLIMGGISYMNSSGDKGKLESARGQVLNSVIGIVVVIMAIAIMSFIEAVFNVGLINYDWAGLQI